MKTKLEAVANIGVILMALAIGAVVLTKYLESSRIPRSVAVGDRLARLPSSDWSQHRQTLVLALNTGCHFCEESVPFYQKLAEAQRRGSDDLQMVAVFPNTPEMVGQFMLQDKLNIRSVAGVPFEKLRVNATPTLILVNSDGQVERSWVGVLTAREEIDVLKLVSGS